MGFPEIGLKAVLQDAGFQQGLAELGQSVAWALGKMQDGSDEAAIKTAQIQEETLKGLQSLGIRMAAMGAVMTAVLTQITLVAARNEELGIVIKNVGRNIGKTNEEIDAYEKGITDLGITTSAARQSMLQMVQSNVDLAYATDLARLAQDAAVIAQRDSSETLQYLIQVVQQADTQMARTLGLVVDFPGAYKKMAAEIGVNVKALTAQEMAQARVNEVMEAGKNIAGTYESAMTSAGKRMRSMARHVEELQAQLGEALLPVMGFLVDAATSALVALRELDPVVMSTGIQLVALAAGVLTVGGAFLTVLPALVAGIGFVTGGIGLLVVGVLAVVAAIAAAVIAFKNLEKASQETAAEILNTSESYESYVRRMEAADLVGRTVTEGLYDMAKAAKDAGEAFDLIEFQKAAEDLEDFSEQSSRSYNTLLALPDAYLSNEQALAGWTKATKGILAGMSDMELEILSTTDAAYKWAIEAGRTEEEARVWADAIRRLATQQRTLAFAMEDASGLFGGWQKAAYEAAGGAINLEDKWMVATKSAGALSLQITAITNATKLSRDEVREYLVVWGYTEKEMEGVIANLDLTGKELHDLTIELGLSRERVLELNKTMGEDEIREYGEALEDAAEATGKTTEEIDEWAQAQDDAVKSVKDLTAVVGLLEEQLEDATEKFEDMVNAYMDGVADIRDATNTIKDENQDHADSVAKLRRDAGADIDEIKQKYNEMLPDATTAEQRLENAGQAWDEWAHRALGSIDDVVSGDEEGWIAHIRKTAEGAGIIQQENESLYDYMHRVVKDFYEGKIPGLIQKGSSQYQAATAEYKQLMDEEIAKAEEAAAAKITAAAEEHRKRQELNRQQRDVAALGAALGIAEADKSLQEFAQKKWPGALGVMFSTAEGFQKGVKDGFIDLNDPQVVAFLKDPMTELRYLLGETKKATEDNVDANRKLWQEGGKGARDMTAAVQEQKDALAALEEKREDLLAQQRQLTQWGKVDPALEKSLADVNDEIEDLTDELDDGPIENMPDDVKTAAEEVDILTASLEGTKNLASTFGELGVTAFDDVRSATVAAGNQVVVITGQITGLGVRGRKALDDINDRLKEMDDSVIDIKIVITTEENPWIPTLTAVQHIDTALHNLPNVIPVNVNLGHALASVQGLGSDIEQAGQYLGDELWRVVMQNASKHKLPWRPPFWGIERAGELGGIGGFFSGLLDEDVERYEELNEQIEETQELLMDPAFRRQLDYGQYLEIMRRYNLALDERNGLEEGYNKALEAQQRLEAAQARVDLLKNQLEFIELLYDQDIDVRPILEQIGIGIDASADDWVTAMAIAMERLAEAAEQNLRDFLGIHSRSEVMYNLGQEMKQGWAEGWASPAPRMIQGMGQTGGGGTSVQMSNDFSGTVINNGMDMVIFQAFIIQTVRKSLRGII